MTQMPMGAVPKKEKEKLKLIGKKKGNPRKLFVRDETKL